MSSLKSFLMAFMTAVNMHHAALYERQRALVRHGILKPVPGRGPGSGVELSSYSVATLLIACAAAPSLSDVDDRIADYCNASPPHDEICPLTGKKTFREAVQAILEQRALMERVYHIVVDHDPRHPGSFIEFRKGRKRLRSVFRWREDPPDWRGITSSSRIHYGALRSLCDSLSKEAGQYEGSS
jgi:hypothetical protein